MKRFFSFWQTLVTFQSGPGYGKRGSNVEFVKLILRMLEFQEPFCKHLKSLIILIITYILGTVTYRVILGLFFFTGLTMQAS